MKIIGCDGINKKVPAGLSLAWLVVLVLSSQAGGEGLHEISWYTIDGGGGMSVGGPYIVRGTVGQPDAVYSAGGQYEVSGGFWSGGPLCIVNFRHFARFAQHWLEMGCGDPDWCGGADLDYLGDVNEVDLHLFVNEWLDYCPYRWPLR